MGYTCGSKKLLAMSRKNSFDRIKVGLANRQN